MANGNSFLVGDCNNDYKTYYIYIRSDTVGRNVLSHSISDSCESTTENPSISTTDYYPYSNSGSAIRPNNSGINKVVIFNNYTC